MNYWLLKSEPGVFSINDLKNMPKATDHWDGVRNYQARNFMRDKMKSGDQAFFYHSSCDNPGIVGIVQIVKEAYPDFTAFDPDSPYFDPKSTPEEPRWYMVDVRYVNSFKRTINLKELKSHSELSDMQLLQRGNRLSVMPVTSKQWKFITNLDGI